MRAPWAFFDVSVIGAPVSSSFSSASPGGGDSGAPMQPGGDNTGRGGEWAMTQGLAHMCVLYE